MEKKQSRQSRVPDHDGGESQGEAEPHLDEREGDQSGSMKRKGRAGKESLLKRSRRKHERRRTARSKGRW